MDFNLFQNEVQLLMFLYGITVVAALIVDRKFFSSESKSFLFLFRFFVASILFAVGYASLNGFHWIILLPFLLLALPISSYKNGEGGNNKNKTIKKGKKVSINLIKLYSLEWKRLNYFS